MSFDKDKLRRTAEKNLSQGKFQAAIKDYCQIVDIDQRDYNTLNTLGDLYVRVGSKDDAIRCFARIADHYETQGFTNKAIAMYKKMFRLMPETHEIAAKLAPLYQDLGLKAEARTNYLIVAEAYQKRGEQLKALEIWQHIADLDPNDIQTRLNLAASFLKEKEKDKAVEAFTEAGSRLLSKKQYEQALNAFTQALEHKPNQLEALKGITEAHIALGYPDEAVELLLKAQELLPDSLEILSLLAQCYIELEHSAAAEEVIMTLVEREPSNYRKLLDVTKIYIKQNELSSAARTIEFGVESLLMNGQENDLEFWLNEILTRNPEHLKGLRMLARLRSWQRHELDLKDALERLAEAARINEAVDEEVDALKELRLLFPAETQYAERLRELGFEAVQYEQSSEYVSDGENPAVPSFESFDPYADASENESYSNEYSEAEWQMAQAFAEDSDSAVTGELIQPTAEVFRFQEHDENQSVPVEELSTDFVAENNISEYSSEYSHEGNQEVFSEVNEAVFIADAADEQASQAEAQIDSEAHLRQELEGVDFYISQGYNDLALESLKLLEVQFGSHEEILKRRDALNIPIETEPASSIKVEAVVVDFNEKAEKDETDGSFEIIFDNAETAQPAAVQVAQTVSSGSNTQAEFGVNAFSDLLEEFGEELHVGDLVVPQTADFETHYNLGLAYKDMGLYDDAVEEFQTAVKMVAPCDGTPRYLQCCNLIGHCFLEKDMPQIAAKWFQRGLEAPGHSDDEYQALRYELGVAYEKAGNIDLAIANYTEIYAVNVAYRSVGEKLRTLQSL